MLKVASRWRRLELVAIKTTFQTTINHYTKPSATPKPETSPHAHHLTKLPGPTSKWLNQITKIKLHLTSIVKLIQKLIVVGNHRKTISGNLRWEMIQVDNQRKKGEIIQVLIYIRPKVLRIWGKQRRMEIK